ncbi:MAG: hypothetical protein HXX17_08160 [Geobacteraceae bacterium]|nr:hypothetical protein [Geobacteraceae bacterium]
MTAIIPFDSGNLPAHIRRSTTNKMVGSSPTGFPVISIKGKVFHQVRGGERTLITKPGEDDPAASLEVVVLDLNAHNSKVFYANGFVEGENGKPTCYSNNGKAPETDAAEPQSKSCATCPHNQWGARISNEGKKLKACADSRRLAIATPDTPADPLLLRVPAASLKAMGEYGKIVAARGLDLHQVITKIGFDYSVAHPALTFKPVGVIADAAMAAEIDAARALEVVAQITGEKPTPPSDVPAEESPAALVAAPQVVATPKPAAQAAPKPAKATSAAAAVEAAVAAAATTKKAVVQVEAPTVVTEVKESSSLEAQIGDLMDGMDFDN